MLQQGPRKKSQNVAENKIFDILKVISYVLPKKHLDPQSFPRRIFRLVTVCTPGPHTADTDTEGPG